MTVTSISTAYTLRHHRPAVGHHNGRRHQLGDRRTGIAGAEDAHGQALALLRKPARAVGNADGERSARDTDEQAGHQVVPVCGAGEISQIGMTVDIISTKNTMRPPNLSVHMPRGRRNQRTGQHRHRNQNAELGFVQVQRLLDRNADHGKHHPDHETDRECKRARRHHRPGFVVLGSHLHSLGIIGMKIRSTRAANHSPDGSRRSCKRTR